MTAKEMLRASEHGARMAAIEHSRWVEKTTRNTIKEIEKEIRTVSGWGRTSFTHYTRLDYDVEPRVLEHFINNGFKVDRRDWVTISWGKESQ